MFKFIVYLAFCVASGIGIGQALSTYLKLTGSIHRSVVALAFIACGIFATSLQRIFYGGKR
ncbi:hypothetical protein CPT_Moonbeam122 [Bacillus phage Moonbeam]|uniref:Uncharacterized protein n=1 Tax=Bacillus phage Moonbeam TaxID=1540091 RepID=A0A0A0RN72_9CAUD|nr:hypothetical protein CPT_Moonbeam122 [Bacillus phage Moonbeam]AIW03520.1 hypothetical protein CPT_Moonbeam122 [Bacillus phage Moonbeam]